MNVAERLTQLLSERKWIAFAGVGVACLLLLVAGFTLFAGAEETEGFVPFEVKQRTLAITVTERGNLESQEETAIRCKVENFGRGDRSGTQIIMIIPNGSEVKEGDLLVELDSATIRDRVDEQTVIVQKAVSMQTQSKAMYDNVLLNNETLKAAAELKSKLAQLAIESYMDKTNGKFQLDVETIDRKIDEANTKLVEARGQLDLVKIQRAGMEELFKLGYRGKAERDQTRLTYADAESRVTSNINQIKTLQSERAKMTLYEFKTQQLTLQGDVETTHRAVEQSVNDGISKAAEALAIKEEAEQTAKKEKERLEHFQKQLENCKIYAPHDGMVVWARRDRRRGEISEGAMVYERQRLMTLPNLKRMKVETRVHEAVLDQVRPGLTVSVSVDAFPNRTYNGVVDKVAVIPEDGGWLSGGSTKTYKTTVRITEDVESLKPGMTAVANIHVDSLPNVLAVPVQAVVQVDRNTWCYVNTGRGAQRKDIVPGRSNDKFVHIEQGLTEGDVVILNPMDILEEKERQASIADTAEELAKEGDTAETKKQSAKQSPQPGPAKKQPGKSKPRGKSKSRQGSNQAAAGA
ncbi:MAG: efflux RND transporter periplasmic adaptor subunit [Planctomycetota bacterium]|nr:efflux RND transporter periplasmic adaptor subunit [Planctomycetota bacterium]